MKKTLLIISLLAIISFPGFSKNNQTDSSAYAKQTVQLKELNAKVDSLLKVTDKLSEEKNYFSADLSSRTIFGVVIAIIISFVGLTLFASFKIEIKKLETKTKSIINEQDEKIKAIKEENKKHNSEINDALANVSILVHDLYKHDTISFIFLLNAAKYNHLNKSYSRCESNLAKSAEIINKTVLPKDFKKNISDYSEDIETDLKQLTNSENEKIKNMAIKIYSKYIEIKEQEPVVEASSKV